MALVTALTKGKKQTVQGDVEDGARDAG